jgi:hypothetical protein
VTDNPSSWGNYVTADTIGALDAAVVCCSVLVFVNGFVNETLRNHQD